ncbi:IclR family transcriptional regulator [Leucobacter komagatae]|uniref:IclR family transcriptional regulator n=1 Tax=Leucobacter komagatae TaxID=55969 RepID=A0A0D0ILK2_9MICO|nr:IclR family transcriptional regulator [Leucobacter komagatae]KIP52002.1 IclR family transcriptional regulator [Leucobacter komagatae]
MDDTSRTPGAQVVSRVAAVLRALSAAMPDGENTTELARAAQLTRPTAHRLLSALTSEGFVDRDPQSGKWLLGPELYLMGTVAADRYDVTDIARTHVAALAAATGESAFFSVRRGGETVCLERQDGNFPIRSFVLHEGKRFPLGVASAGLAILSFLTPHAVDAFLTESRLEDDFGGEHAETAIRARISETRRTGYAVNPGLIVPGSWGLGAAVFSGSGQPAWALSLTGVESRFSPERIPELGRLLLEHAHQLTEQLARK